MGATLHAPPQADKKVRVSAEWHPDKAKWQAVVTVDGSRRVCGLWKCPRRAMDAALSNAFQE